MRKYVPAFATGITAGPATAMLAASSSPAITFGVIGGLIVTATMMVWPFYAFLLTVLTVPLERIGRLTDDSSQYTFSIMRIMGVITLSSLLLHCALLKRKLRFPLPMLFYAGYLAFGFFSLTYTSDSFSGIRQAPALLGNLLFFFLVPNLVQTRAHVRIVLICWLVVTFAVGVFTIYGWHKGNAVTDSRFHSTGERSTGERFSVVLLDQAEFDLDAKIPRALGPTSHPAVYAINLIMTLPFFVLFLTSAQKARWRIFWGLGLLVTAYNVFLTNTRAAVVVMAAVLALTVVTGIVRINFKIVFALLVLGAAAIPLMPSALYERIFNAKNYTAQRSATLSARFRYWEAAVDAIREHPMLGVGLGNQNEIPRRLNLRLPQNSSVHNEYLFSLMEVGFVGYSVLVTFFVLLHRRAREAEKIFRSRADPASASLVTAARVVFWGVLFYAVQVDCFHFPLKGWWLVMGLVLVLHRIAREAQTGESTSNTAFGALVAAPR
jgi:O-antigen ligase